MPDARSRFRLPRLPESVAHFTRDWNAGDVFPDTVLGELQGVIDGCYAANPATNVTKERLIALNYGG